MDVLALLKERTGFIRRHFEKVNNFFRDTKRMIDQRESPYDADPPGYDIEAGLPAYLDEWMEADAHQEFLGQSCVSYLAANLKVFFDEMRDDFQGCSPLRVFATRLANEKGFVVANQKWFDEIGVDFKNSGADLAIVEEVVTTRNSAQHPKSLITMSVHLQGKQVKVQPIPWFAHEFEREGVDPADPASLENFSWTVSITPERFLPALEEVEKLCEFVFNESRALQYRVGCFTKDDAEDESGG